MSFLIDSELVGALPYFSYEEVRKMNVRFAEAMLDARKRGLETFTIGAVKDYTPMVPTYFPRIEYVSSCGSSAASCAEESDWMGSGRHRTPMLGGT